MVSYGSDSTSTRDAGEPGWGQGSAGGLRLQAEGCRLVFTSSIAAFGGDALPEVVTDNTKLTPETTYGTTKAICELLVNDYARKGFVDGRTAAYPPLSSGPDDLTRLPPPG